MKEIFKYVFTYTLKYLILTELMLLLFNILSVSKYICYKDSLNWNKLKICKALKTYWQNNLFIQAENVIHWCILCIFYIYYISDQFIIGGDIK